MLVSTLKLTVFIDFLTEQSIVDLVLYFNHSYHNRFFFYVWEFFFFFCYVHWFVMPSTDQRLVWLAQWCSLSYILVWELSESTLDVNTCLSSKFSSLWFFNLKIRELDVSFFFSVMIEFKNPPPPGNINFIKWWTIKKFNDVHMNWQGPTHLLVCLKESFGAAKHDKNGFNCIYLTHNW